jgi:O-methyltransferase
MTDRIAPNANRMISGIRYFTSLVIPGDTSTGVKGSIIKGLSDTVSFAGQFLQGIDPVWKNQQAFVDIYNAVRSKVTLDQKSAHVLFNFVKHCQNIDGDMAEVGVYKGGGSKIILSQAKPSKCLHMFDTFTGFPAVDKGKDLYWKKGDFNNVDVDAIRKDFAGDNIKLYVGKFPDTTKDVAPNLTFCFVHLDTDLYQSQLDGCAYFYSRMNSGGVMLLDNYGSLSCPGAKTSVDEFFADKPENVIYVPTGQAFVIKL